MHKIQFNTEVLYAEDGQLLSEVLIKNGKDVEHLCSGRGLCKKCEVKVNGERALSCKYRVKSDITVEWAPQGEIFSFTGDFESGELTEDMCFCLDIGTTTLALALVSLDGKSIVKVETATNPQRAFGADVISRIEYCSENGIQDMQKAVVEGINSMIEKFPVGAVEKMIVAANTTMLHIFLGEDPSSMGVAPYKAKFLKKRRIQAQSIGIKSVKTIETLPCVHAFVGADIVSGINFAEKPPENKFNLLVDLGTNAEIALYSRECVACTSAAAGPCFEGAGISCGMSAQKGAVYSYKIGCIKTIGGEIPKGICGTGLVDVIAQLLSNGVIDRSGYMQEDFEISPRVELTQEDVRCYQLAKSAVYSGIITLLKETGTDFKDIEKVFISGGFSAKLNIENAVRTGLLPKELSNKCEAVYNSSLMGAVKYACEGNDLGFTAENGEYINLSSNTLFSELFIENMMF